MSTIYSVETLKAAGMRFDVQKVDRKSQVDCEECATPLDGLMALEVTAPIQGFFCRYGSCMRANVSRYME